MSFEEEGPLLKLVIDACCADVLGKEEVEMKDILEVLVEQYPDLLMAVAEPQYVRGWQDGYESGLNDGKLL
jgi:hypothetical protein